MSYFYFYNFIYALKLLYRSRNADNSSSISLLFSCTDQDLCTGLLLGTA